MNEKYIHHAAHKGDLYIVQKHIENYGVPADLVTVYYKVTPLIQAVKGGHLDIVQYLLKGEPERLDVAGNEFDFKVDVNHQDFDGRSAIFYAVSKLSTFTHEIIQALVEAGASLELTDNWETTPVMHATSSGHSKILESVLEHVEIANMNELLFNYCEQLCIEDSIGSNNGKEAHKRQIDYLISNGASATATSKHGDTTVELIDVAVHSDDIDLVQVLIDHGASCSRAYEHALEYGNRDLADYLEPKLIDLVNEVVEEPSSESSSDRSVSPVLLEYEEKVIDSVSNSDDNDTQNQKIEEVASREPSLPSLPCESKDEVTYDNFEDDAVKIAEVVIEKAIGDGFKMIAQEAAAAALTRKASMSEAALSKEDRDDNYSTEDLIISSENGHGDGDGDGNGNGHSDGNGYSDGYGEGDGESSYSKEHNKCMIS